jgi:hypothetical protein
MGCIEQLLELKTLPRFHLVSWRMSMVNVL